MTSQPNKTDRRRIRVNGDESLADVVRAVFADIRVMPLVVDLNPALAQRGRLPSGSVVVCPSKVEAQAFARKMGFTLGFDECAGNGTGQKRAWARLQTPAPKPQTRIDPVEAASKLLDTGIGAAEVARRLATMCAASDLDVFVSQRAGDVRLPPVQRALELYVLYPRAHARLHRTIAVLESTTTARGLRALLAAAAAAPQQADAVLSCTLLPEGARRALLANASTVSALVVRAKELARIERGARELAYKATSDAAVLRLLVDAVVDGVEPLAGERLARLGLERSWQDAVGHIDRLKEMLRGQLDVLARAGNDVVRTIARDDPGQRLQRPWPLVVAVTRGLGPLVDALGGAAVDDGVGGLVRTPAAERASSPSAAADAPVVRASALITRAVVGARDHDDGAAVAERLAPRVAALFTSCRPLAGDHGPATLRRARRRAHYESAMLGTSAPQPAGIGSLVDDVIAVAGRLEIAGVHRMPRAHVDAARAIASRLTGNLCVHQRRASELARAVVVVAMVADPELAGLVARESGREALRQTVERHAGRLLSRACLAYVDAAA